jgi:methyl-accepting chemotaxis protein
MKLGKKLFLMILILNLVGTVALVGTILGLTRQQVSGLINNEIHALAAEKALRIQTWLDGHLGALRSIGQIMERYEQIAADERREWVNLMIKTMVEANPEVIGASGIWEPNALDELDREFIGAQDTDDTGRFLPYWSKTKAGVQVEPLVGFDIPGEGDYYLIPKQTGKEALTEPYMYPVDGVDVFMTTVTVPIKNQGRFVGAVTRDIEIDIIQQQVERIRPYEGSVAAVYSHNGLIAGHFDARRVGKSIQETEQDIAGPHVQKLIASIQNGQEFTFIQHVPLLKKEMLFTSVPFTVGDTNTPWAIIVGIPTQIISAPLYRILLAGLLIGGITIILVSIGAFIMARSISRPIAHTMTVLKGISEGDLTQRININSKDELGDLARYLNFTIDEIKQLIYAIKKEADLLLQTGTDLAVNMSEADISIGNITANIQGVKSQMEKQQASVTGAGSIMGYIDALNAQIQKQTDCVVKSSSSIEQMLANIESVTQSLIKNVVNVTKLTEASEIGRSGLEEVSIDIQTIARESEGLLEINAVMENIASQTNLLSMNAAIEAAHAGESGKGFAVVAAEIRKLAESSGAQSKTIGDVLKKIKGSIDKITKSTNEVLQKFEAIGDGVRLVQNQETSVRNVMEEQSKGSKDILEVISSLNEISGEVKTGAHALLEGSRSVIKESEVLEQIAEAIKSGINEVASGVDQINAAVHRVNKISSQNKENTNVLAQEVSHFKVE